MITQSKAIVTNLQALVVAHQFKVHITLKEALKDKVQYQAMKCEYEALMRKNTWCLVPAPPRRKIIDNKCLFRVKELVDFQLDKLKP